MFNIKIKHRRTTQVVLHDINRLWYRNEPVSCIKKREFITLSHSMPSTWYHRITPPVKCFGCWKGTGSPLHFRTGSKKNLVFCLTVWDNLSLIILFESLFFWRFSSQRLEEELSTCKEKNFYYKFDTLLSSIIKSNY